MARARWRVPVFGVAGRVFGGCQSSISCPPAAAAPGASRLVDVTELINVVGGAVVDSLADPRSLLVARRTAPPQFAGMWEFPGGKVDPGRDPGTRPAP